MDSYMEVKNLGLEEKLFDYVLKSVIASPFYNLVGLSLKSLGPGSAEMAVTPGNQHTNPIDLIHGGVIMTAADAAMGNSVRTLGIKPVTVECSTSFLSSAELGRDIIAGAKVIKSGKNLFFTEAEVWSEDHLIATAKAVFFNIGKIEL